MYIKLYSRNSRTVKYGTETISYLEPKIWSIVSQTIKESTSIHSFKINIRKWKPDCHVGFAKDICSMSVLYKIKFYFLS